LKMLLRDVEQDLQALTNGKNLTRLSASID
jgi:hypothetical protein